MVNFAYNRDRWREAPGVRPRTQPPIQDGSVTALPQTEAHWMAPLPGVLRGPDGERLLTLQCAFALLSTQAGTCRNPALRRAAADLMLRGARTGSPGDVAAASERMERYLRMERETLAP